MFRVREEQVVELGELWLESMRARRGMQRSGVGSKDKDNQLRLKFAKGLKIWVTGQG